jgi:isochorismate pyruvate lyase
LSDLEALRREIDRLDSAIVSLLAERFRLVDQVIAVKQKSGAPAIIPERIEEVVGRVLAEARARGIPGESAEKLWRLLIAETVRYEERALTPR